tara:strand:- start:7681 stop:7992 length:312 start_codon:yes stop_codon:yes gene_type:complete
MSGNKSIIVKVNCECGGKYTGASGKKRHMKTKIHLNYKPPIVTPEVPENVSTNGRKVECLGSELEMSRITFIEHDCEYNNYDDNNLEDCPFCGISNCYCGSGY